MIKFWRLILDIELAVVAIFALMRFRTFDVKRDRAVTIDPARYTRFKFLGSAPRQTQHSYNVLVFGIVWNAGEYFFPSAIRQIPEPIFFRLRSGFFVWLKQ